MAGEPSGDGAALMAIRFGIPPLFNEVLVAVSEPAGWWLVDLQPFFSERHGEAGWHVLWSRSSDADSFDVAELFRARCLDQPEAVAHERYVVPSQRALDGLRRLQDAADQADDLPVLAAMPFAGGWMGAGWPMATISVGTKVGRLVPPVLAALRSSPAFDGAVDGASRRIAPRGVRQPMSPTPTIGF